MRMVDIIQKKRDGFPLDEKEIRFLIEGYTKEKIPDYQLSAWAMAVYFQGMNALETALLTDAMASSGERVDLSPIQGIKVDKHSTGGVGDKTTLIVGPLVAACGVPVAKMSGRGLGHTGGTIDKLEAIPGFQVELTREEFIYNVNSIGLSIISQSGNVTPADKKLYALRDVTATVDSIPLIASSVMSKKLASGADAIVLDVKYGSGAFMKTKEEAETLARAMVDIGKEVGRQTIGILSSMEQPLGYAVGNALEVKEAIATLKGQGPEDLTELCLTLSAWMIYLGRKAPTIEEARSLAKQALYGGKALSLFDTFVAAQGGDSMVSEKPEDVLPQAKKVVEVLAPRAGYISRIHGEKVGLAAMKSGAGRETKESSINLSAGVVLHKKRGEKVEVNQSLAEIHYDSTIDVDSAIELLLEAYEFTPHPGEESPLIGGVIQ